ncbi:MAG: ABC transporter permease [Crocinitomicaceae bacterium]|nr:ABC transporter permease [Crocinitomicaceae bacterium]|tara:strand:+ start:7197 stop:7937 length:741 start_codon:yes stop_codon:yes gene_type:complete
MKILYHIGHYALFLKKSFEKPERRSVYWKLFIDEIVKLGIGSIGIIIIISGFMGMVITIQTASQIDGNFIPDYLVGWTTRQSVILEFSTTMLALILAGKIGSNVASEIGTMRVTEQIDALEIMGINSAGYLVIPKIYAFMIIMPFLVVISMFTGIYFGYLICELTGIISPSQYLFGLQYDFRPFDVSYAFIKSIVFAFVISSVSSYHGYFVGGGALEVGKASTRAVVYSSIVVLVMNYLITQMLLI